VGVGVGVCVWVGGCLFAASFLRGGVSPFFFPFIHCHDHVCQIFIFFIFPKMLILKHKEKMKIKKKKHCKPS
jgi:hypothetical protein